MSALIWIISVSYTHLPALKTVGDIDDAEKIPRGLGLKKIAQVDRNRNGDRLFFIPHAHNALNGLHQHSG